LKPPTRSVRVSCLIRAAFTWGLSLAPGALVVTADTPLFDPLDGNFDVSQYLAENAFGVLPVPIVITEPAVDGGVGAAGIFFHESDEQRERRMDALQNTDEGAGALLLTPSASALAGAYMGNGSYFVGGGHMGFWKQGRVRYMGGGGYGDVSLDFYGTGDAPIANPIEINTEAVALLQSLKFKLGELPVFAGVAQRYVSARLSASLAQDSLAGHFGPDVSPEQLSDAEETLTGDTTLSALGLVLELDTRDNFFSPHAGYRYELEHLWYRDVLGSDIDYQLTEFSGLNYWTLTQNWRLALRLNGQLADTDDFLPPFATPAIKLRGIPAARYQGNAVGVLEAEVTHQINYRWSVNVFAGTGRAADAFGELSSSDARNAGGAGFRYLIARRYGFEMGLDVARGPEDTVFYIQAGTAW